MKQQISETHNVNADGNPMGGETTGLGITISWQNGPLGRDDHRKAPNGAFVEGVIAAALGRLEFYQTTGGGRFACSENASAIEHLQQALSACNQRTQRRVSAGVEGTHTPESEALAKVAAIETAASARVLVLRAALECAPEGLPEEHVARVRAKFQGELDELRAAFPNLPEFAEAQV